MKINKKIIIAIIILAVTGLSIALIVTKKGTKSPDSVSDNKVIKTTTKAIELKPEEKPHISLIPRADGHELKLKIENIPSIINQIEYELVYTAKDKNTNLEMEKGVGDTIKEISKNIERDLLLGTSSCTNGCKYAYDEGVTGGILSLTFTTKDGQASFETPFTLTTSSEIQKNKGLGLPEENFMISATTTTKSDYFILIKNYQNSYSVFSNGSGLGKITGINPSNVTKTNTNNLLGDYLIN